MPRGPVYAFAEFRLDTSARLLYRNGKRVPLTPRAVDLLLVLDSRGGQPYLAHLDDSESA